MTLQTCRHHDLWLPLGGPLVMTGFFGAIVNLFVLGPLLSLAWRQRKYMADATAVRLTRDPDTLSGALEQMTKERGTPIASWAAHMSVTDHTGQRGGVFAGSAVPIFPSTDRRLRALGTLGAHITRKAGPKMPVELWLIIGPLVGHPGRARRDHAAAARLAIARTDDVIRRNTFRHHARTAALARSSLTPFAIHVNELCFRIPCARRGIRRNRALDLGEVRQRQCYFQRPQCLGKPVAAPGTNERND